MENVLYIIGAGFSAPLGIPVMSNFMAKAKDMFADNSAKLKHFEAVFKKVKDLHTIKSYIDTDLFNIEEVFSLLEMNKYLGNDTAGKGSEDLEKFIKDVIKHYSKTALSHSRIRDYQDFVDALINTNASNTKYAIITLNYDTVIESCIQYLHKEGRGTIPLKKYYTTDTTDSYPKDKSFLSMAKIHGSVDSDIIPPTWSKSSDDKIQKVWQLAKILIEQANQIRFLGYSLPKTDTHFKYLLMSGIMNAPNIKKIDALCLDDKRSSVKQRYENLIIFNNFRFKNENISNYLQCRYGYDLEPRHQSIFG